MATISELESVRRNPVKEGVNAFRDLFHLTYADLSIAVSSDEVQVVFLTLCGFSSLRLQLSPQLIYRRNPSSVLL
jgi:hypothetical protein